MNAQTIARRILASLDRPTVTTPDSHLAHRAAHGLLGEPLAMAVEMMTADDLREALDAQGYTDASVADVDAAVKAAASEMLATPAAGRAALAKTWRTAR